MITCGDGINVLLDSTRASLAPLGYVCGYDNYLENNLIRPLVVVGRFKLEFFLFRK